jgi:Na+/melibiose symporter-like transporter
MLLATRIDQGLARYSLVLAALALACTLVMKIAAPSPHYPQAPTHALSWRDLFLPLGHPGFRHLFAVFMLNGIASALPATLVLFFISDALGLERDAGTFLAAYFGAGAVGLPLWMAISRHIGKVQAWRAAMLLAVAGFAGAWMLGSGDFAGFLAVCVISGLALGADLALPPSLLADLLRATADESRQANTSASETNGAGASEPIGAGAPEPIGAGASAGLWNFATKLNLALAAGLALPLLQFTGYTPGGSNIAPLYWAYCLLPCVLKLAAAALLSVPPPSRHTIPSVETRS